MALNKNVVELVDYFVAVDVCAGKLVVGKKTGFEVVTLNQNVVELIDCAIVVNVAQFDFGLNNGRLYNRRLYNGRCACFLALYYDFVDKGKYAA